MAIYHLMFLLFVTLAAFVATILLWLKTHRDICFGTVFVVFWFMAFTLIIPVNCSVLKCTMTSEVAESFDLPKKDAEIFFREKFHSRNEEYAAVDRTVCFSRINGQLFRYRRHGMSDFDILSPVLDEQEKPTVYENYNKFTKYMQQQETHTRERMNSELLLLGISSLVTVSLMIWIGNKMHKAAISYLGRAYSKD